MKNTRALITLTNLLAWVLISTSLTAQDITNTVGVQAAYYFPNMGGYEASGYTPITTEVLEAETAAQRDLGTSWGGAEFEMYFIHSRSYPFLQGDGLMADNNIRLRFRTGLSPVTLTQSAEVTLTPIAFLTFTGGAQIGTGWPALGFNGLGLNEDGEPLQDAFPGVVLETWINPGFQFDLAALVPGDWNHIVVLVGEKWTYQWFSAAGPEDPWQYLADSGENFNGWKRSGSYFLGHQPPLSWLDTYGILVESNGRLFGAKNLAPMDSTVSGENWGSDFSSVSIGALLNLQVTNDASLALLFQANTIPKYSDATIREKYFANRDYEGTNWAFNRLAVVFEYGL